MAKTKQQEMKEELRQQEREKQELYISICNDPEKGYRSNFLKPINMTELKLLLNKGGKSGTFKND